MSELKENIRGYLESTLDELIQEADLLSSVAWLQREKDEIVQATGIEWSPLKNLAVGYAIGSLELLLRGVIKLSEQHGCSEEDIRIVRGMLRRRLPEIAEKIVAELHK